MNRSSHRKGRLGALAVIPIGCGLVGLVMAFQSGAWGGVGAARRLSVMHVPPEQPDGAIRALVESARPLPSTPDVRVGKSRLVSPANPNMPGTLILADVTSLAVERRLTREGTKEQSWRILRLRNGFLAYPSVAGGGSGFIAGVPIEGGRGTMLLLGDKDRR